MMNRQGPGKIEWTDYTWSPVTGCKHGCDYCYARRIADRIYPEKFEPTFRPNRLGEPSKVKTPSKIFVSDMGDLLGAWVPDAWIAEVLADIEDGAEHHTYQFLTKNPDRYLDWRWKPNHWLGTTIENQASEAIRSEPMSRLREQLVRFASIEPLLGPIELDNIWDWIIIGERSDTPYNPEVEVWAKDLIDQARELDIPVFVKNRLKAKFPIQEFPKSTG
jgi:protein gp37